MAKYAMSESGKLYGPEMRALHTIMTPVIVLPEADWRELESEWKRIRGRVLSSPDSSMTIAGDRIDAIIQRTEAENG